MADPFGFQLNLTGTFAKALAPVNKNLAETDQLLSKVSASSENFLNLADHAKIGKGFEGFFGNVRQASLGLQDHTKIAESLVGVFGGLSKLQPSKELNLVDEVLGKIGGKLGGGIFSLGFAGAFTMGIFQGVDVLKAGAEAFVDLIKKGFDLAVETAEKIINASAKAQSQQVSLDFLLGDKKQSKQLRGDLSSLSKFTPFEGGDLASAARPLLLGGMKQGEQLTNIITAAVDTSVALGKDQADRRGILENAIGVFERVQSTGKVEGRALRGLAIEQDKYFANLGQLLGVSAEVAKKRAEEGKIAKETLISVILDEMQKRQGGALGRGAEAGANTAETQLDKLSKLPEQYFKRMSESKAFGSFSRILDKLLTALDPDGPAGRRIIAGINYIADQVSAIFAELGGGDPLGGAMKAIFFVLSGLELLVAELRAAVHWALAFVDAIEGMVQALRGIPDWFVRKFTGTDKSDQVAMFNLAKKQSADRAADEETHRQWLLGVAPRAPAPLAPVDFNFSGGYNAGAATADGFAAGMGSGALGVRQAADQLATSPVDQIQSTLGIHSPSRVFAELGRYTAAGFADGITSSMGMIDQAVDAAYSMPFGRFVSTSTASSTAPDSAGRMLSVGDIYVTVEGGGDAQIGKEIGRGIRVELLKLLDEAESEIGAD